MRKVLSASTTRLLAGSTPEELKSKHGFDLSDSDASANRAAALGKIEVAKALETMVNDM